jgi:NifU-like protein involved in Fe-S cluster formation
MFGDLYHNRVLELAADIPHLGRLADAQGSSLKVSRVCGSTVEVDVTLDADGRIAEIAVEPKACALGQAATSILTRHAVGRSLAEIESARGNKDQARTYWEEALERYEKLGSEKMVESIRTSLSELEY